MASRALLAALLAVALPPSVPFDRSPSLRDPSDRDGPYRPMHTRPEADLERIEAAQAKRARKNARRLESTR